MDAVSRDFGTGLLEYLRRSPRWEADRREPVRVAWTPVAADEEQPRRASLSALPLLAALIAPLAS